MCDWRIWWHFQLIAKLLTFQYHLQYFSVLLFLFFSASVVAHWTMLSYGIGGASRWCEQGTHWKANRTAFSEKKYSSKSKVKLCLILKLECSGSW